MEKAFKIGLSDEDKLAMINNIKSQTLSTLIPAYSTSIEYSIGQYVVYNDALYRCIGTTTGAWDSTKWESATLEDLVDDVNGAVTDVAHKANIDGYYSTMGVGHADSALSLDTNVGNNDETPFNYQTAGGTSDIATGIQKLKKLVGASVVMNQLVQNGNFTNTSNWSAYQSSFAVSNNEATITVGNYASGAIYQDINGIAGHKYLFISYMKKSNENDDYIAMVIQGTITQSVACTSTNYQLLTYIATPTESGNIRLNFRGNQSEQVFYTKNVQIFDLTQMFGSQVADYLYNLTNNGGVAIFRTMFSNEYYEYNTGTFIHSKSAKLKMVDYNQFNKATAVSGYISDITGELKPSSTLSASDYIQVIPGQTLSAYGFDTSDNYGAYYDINKNYIQSANFHNGETSVVPSNAYYLRKTIGRTSYIDTACIFIYWDGSRIGYEPYHEHIYELPNDELKGILKVVDNKIVADGDEEYPDGTKKVRYGSYTFTGNETFETYGNGYKFSGLVGLSANKYNSFITDCGLPTQSTPTPIADSSQGIHLSNNGMLYLSLSASQMVGKTIQYELATPTETTATAFAENIYVDDFGTMEFLDENNARITGIQGNEIFYKANISGFAESLYVKTDGDVEELVTQEDISDTALATRGYIKLTSITGYDATKTQVLKNIEGVFTWVDEV